MGNTTSSGQNTANNSNTSSNTNYGSNTNSNTAQNTAQNSITQGASGPSAAAQGFLNTINPMNTAANINAFQNPYQQQVLNAQLALQNQQGGEAQAQLLGNSPGAINGNRLGEAQATLQRQLQLANNATNTGILSQGFNTAANLATTQGQQALGAAGLAGTQTSQGTQQLGSTQGTTQAGTLGGTSTAQSTAQAGTGSGSQTTTPGLLSYAGLGAGLLAADGGAISYADGGAPRPLKIPKSFPLASIGDFGELHFVPKKHPKKFGDGGTADSGQANPYSMEGIQKAIKAMLDHSQGTASKPSAPGTQGSQGFNLASDEFNSGAKIGQGLSTAGQNIGNKLFGTSQDPNSQGFLGSGGLGSTLSNAGSSIADFAGFAKGGSTDQATAPSSSFYSPVSMRELGIPAQMPTQGGGGGSPLWATSNQYYNPISFAPGQAQMPSMAAPQVSMPGMPAASVAQATVPFPTAPRASSGKGSGGAVRAYHAGGRARHRETSAAAPRKFADGGGEDSDYAPAAAAYGISNPEAQAGDLSHILAQSGAGTQPLAALPPTVSLGAPASTAEPPVARPASAPQPQPSAPPVQSGVRPLALDTIKGFEGYTPKAKWDYKQYSGGYGTKAEPGQTYTPESAQAALIRSIAPVHNWISENIKTPMTDKQYAGLASFGFNLGTGPGGLSDLKDDINAGNWQRAAERMQRYNHAGGEENEGLTNRRASEGALVLNQEQNADTFQPSAIGRLAHSAVSPVQRALGISSQNPVGSQNTSNKYLVNGTLGEGARGILGALGVNTSPESLGKISRLLMAMGQGQGFQGGMGNEELLLKQQQAQRDAMHLASQLRSEQAHLTQPVVTGQHEWMDQFGQVHKISDYGAYDPATGWPKPAPATGSPTNNPQVEAIKNPNNLPPEEYLKTIPAGIASDAKSIATYKLPPLTGRSLTTPAGEMLMTAAQKYAEANGEAYDATLYPQKQQAQKDWVAASSGTTKVLTNGNTGIGHLRELVGTVEDLQPTSMYAWNALSNMIGGQFDTKAAAKAGAYEENAGKLAEELTAFYRGTGGAEADIKRELANLNPANGPNYQKAVIGKIADMVLTKTEALKQRRDFAFGREKGEKMYPILTPKSAQELQEIRAWAHGGNAGGAGGSSLPKITGDNDPVYRNLQSGDSYIAPDGRELTKR